jgi:hypothetical protein
MKEKEKVIISGRSFKIHRSRRSRRIVLCVRRRSGRRRREGGGGAGSSLSSTSIIFSGTLACPRPRSRSRLLPPFPVTRGIFPRRCTSRLTFPRRPSSPAPPCPVARTIRAPLREESHDDESVSSHINAMQQCQRDGRVAREPREHAYVSLPLDPSVRPSVDPRSDLSWPAGLYRAPLRDE